MGELPEAWGIAAAVQAARPVERASTVFGDPAPSAPRASQGSGRSYGARSAASAAYKLAVVSAARLRPPRSCGAPLANHQAARQQEALAKTPDLVAADLQRRELLVLEVTIVPDEALGRYFARKRQKYAALCRAANAPTAAADGDSAGEGAVDVSGGGARTAAAGALALRALPPVVVAVGTSGALHPASAAALREVVGLDEGQLQSFASEAAAIARARPGAGAAGVRRRMRGARRGRRAVKSR